MSPARGDFGNCRSCGARVLWAVTESGTTMPLDAQPRDDGTFFAVEDANGVLPFAVHVDGMDIVAAAARSRGGARRVSHFATCPNSVQHRRAR